MNSLIEQVAASDVTGHAAAVRTAAVLDVQARAHRLVAALDPATDGPGRADGGDPERAWGLACLRIALAAGMDGVEDVVMLRRSGATWAQIGAVAGITRQSAHERWNARVLEVLDRYGLGELGGRVADDDPRST
ncbi:hypothetical protein [Pseudonocardia sp. KRD291]|uniref:hypothetical protein n=1 Tax=Pseudonocardia sp. KRD291 TaxID=2792007 RepID=UPI001C4A3E64|nr:hypothetical protein [Pseudonocardia sp. KRD291]MBW0104225.1 hypothetical protein [Pseudonocardia sp. KRD291]